MNRLIRAWLLTGVTDGLFSSILVSVFYGSTVTRLWQGVASVLLGKEALDGGLRTAAIGLGMHFGVAFAWSLLFYLLYTQVAALRSAVASNAGMIAAAALYGPVIWLTMSCLVIPSMTHNPPAITYKWWIQFFGHIPFVAIPIISSIRTRNAPA